MYAIIIQYIIFYIAAKKSSTSTQIVLVATILTILSMAGMYKAHFGGWWFISQPSFVFGMIVAAFENSFRKLFTKYTISIVIPIFIVASTSFMIYPRYLALFLFSNLMPLLIYFVVCTYGSTKNRVLQYLGKISLEIYLIHGLAIVGVCNWGISWYALTISVFLITMPLSAVAHKIGIIISSS
jgi:peptidoglycan/LPS O-acetylase OafA/YrhL